MSLRQKLIVLSKSPPAAETKYDQGLVQRLFLKPLKTGLISESNVRDKTPIKES